MEKIITRRQFIRMTSGAMVGALFFRKSLLLAEPRKHLAECGRGIIEKERQRFGFLVKIDFAKASSEYTSLISNLSVDCDRAKIKASDISATINNIFNYLFTGRYCPGEAGNSLAESMLKKDLDCDTISPIIADVLIARGMKAGNISFVLIQRAGEGENDHLLLKIGNTYHDSLPQNIVGKKPLGRSYTSSQLKQRYPGRILHCHSVQSRFVKEGYDLILTKFKVITLDERQNMAKTMNPQRLIQALDLGNKLVKEALSAAPKDIYYLGIAAYFSIIFTYIYGIIGSKLCQSYAKEAQNYSKKSIELGTEDPGTYKNYLDASYYLKQQKEARAYLKQKLGHTKEPYLKEAIQELLNMNIPAN